MRCVPILAAFSILHRTPPDFWWNVSLISICHGLSRWYSWVVWACGSGEPIWCWPMAIRVHSILKFPSLLTDFLDSVVRTQAPVVTPSENGRKKSRCIVRRDFQQADASNNTNQLGRSQPTSMRLGHYCPIGKTGNKSVKGSRKWTTVIKISKKGSNHLRNLPVTERLRPHIWADIYGLDWVWISNQ